MTYDEMESSLRHVRDHNRALARDNAALRDLVRLMWDTHVRCGDNPSAYAWTRVREEAEGLGIRLDHKGSRR